MEIMTKSQNASVRLVPHKVVALIYDGLTTFEFGIVAEIFGLPRPELGRDLYDFRSVALESGSLRAAGGLLVKATDNMSILGSAETIIVPGWRGKDSEVPEIFRKTLQAAYLRGTRIMSICSGVYVLAAAGLLDGKTVTTHWRYVKDFKNKFPNVILKPNELYIQDENILTSAGSSAGIDACLHMVRMDYGATIANSVARRLVMHAHRQGDQAQYIEQPVPTSGGDHRLSLLMENLRLELDKVYSITSLAASTGMSVRTFQRRFVAFTGMAPMKWLTLERLSQARIFLETTSLSVDEISDKLGFGNAETLRYQFRKTLDISPSNYRKRFRCSI